MTQTQDPTEGLQFLDFKNIVLKRVLDVGDRVRAEITHGDRGFGFMTIISKAAFSVSFLITVQQFPYRL